MNKVPEKNSEAVRAAKLAQAVEANMKALASVMEEELGFLHKQDMDGVMSLRDEKVRLLRDYRSHIAALIQNPTLLKEAPEEARADLRKTGEVLADVAQRNATGLKAAITATQGVLQIIMDAAREEAKPMDSYSKDVRAAYSPTCPPVAVNRTA